MAGPASFAVRLDSAERTASKWGRQFKEQQFSFLVACRYDPKDHTKILATTRLTPIYRFEGT